jgi:hypothetical protein
MRLELLPSVFEHVQLVAGTQMVPVLRISS